MTVRLSTATVSAKNTSIKRLSIEDVNLEVKSSPFIIDSFEEVVFSRITITALNS